MPSIALSLLWFVLIVALIPLALWLLKRTRIGGAGNSQLMRTVGSLPLSPSQRLVTVELGRTRIPIKHILQLAQGSVVELDAMAGEPMDVLVNGYLIAQGEVVVVNDKFGIRLTDIVTPSERMRRLSKG